ncbi:MAG: DUF3450 family protein [Myxococcota bacterium]
MRIVLALPKPPRLVLAIAVLLVSPSFGVAEEAAAGAAAFRVKMEKWVETRRILSAERADWLVERESLQATRKLLRRERDDLRAEIEAFVETGADASEERRDLLRQRAEYQQADERLEADIRRLEAQVLALVPQLPDPLRDRLELLLVQIPEDPANPRVPLGQRLMNVLGVLAQAEKWNATATFVGETRPVGPAGQRIQVRTLYWGLGQAIYVDTQGKVAGLGRPGADGWSFIDDASLADDARLFLDSHEGNVDTIAFVPIPVDVE